MAEFSLDRFKYRWRGEWSPSLDYRKDDVITRKGKSYVCLIAHTSAANFRTDLNAIIPGSSPPVPDPKWVVMTSGKAFLGPWETAEDYDLGDIVLYQGSLYKCTYAHTSNSFVEDAYGVEFDQPSANRKWELFASGQDFIGDWVDGTEYGYGAVVKYGGDLWICRTPHSGNTNLENDINKWDRFYEGYSYRSVWIPDRQYFVNDYVRYGASLFKCIETHTSEGTAIDETKFDFDIPGSQFDGEWSSTTNYNIGDIVRYGGTLYYAITNNIDRNPSAGLSDTNDSTVDWIVLAKTYRFRGQWGVNEPKTITINVTAGIDTVVGNATGALYLDNSIKSVLNLTRGDTILFDLGSASLTSYASVTHPLKITQTLDGTAWTTGIKYILDGAEVTYSNYVANFATAKTRNLSWTLDDDTPSQMYYGSITSTGEGARIDVSDRRDFNSPYDVGYLTGDIVQRGGQLFVALTDVSVSDGDGSTLDYLDNEAWEKLATNKKYVGPWREGQVYSVGDIAILFGSAYSANIEHLSEWDNAPGDNGNVYQYWDLLIQAGVPGGMQYPGDMLTYGLTRTVFGDGSTLGPDRVPIGTTGQALSIGPDQESEAEELALFWRNRVNDSDTVYVATNGVDDIGYGTKESPFRSVRYACEYVEDNFAPLTPTKVFVGTGRFEEVGPISVPAGCVVMGDELRATSIVASGPKADYVNDYLYHSAALDHLESLVANLFAGTDIIPRDGNDKLPNFSFGISDLSSTNYLVGLVTDYNNYIEFNAIDGSVNPTMTGTNTLNSSEGRINASTILNGNKDFIAEDCYWYIKSVYPDVTFDKAKVRNDVLNAIRGFVRDLKYDGNYLTINQAKYYANSISGSQNTDLFWMRDTTGLRNCTTDGLTGTLNPPNVFTVYQKPTGGSLVALDPGWGPNDSRTWINNRSPYIQGVTNIGTACVGQKIDGSLHNGGNRSMVSNDFTQVLSDGIGAWVVNNARAELVSVFTYYCAIGYLAENGGVIRATNGNNSYGKYGSISDGRDVNETPQTVAVDNRQNEAQVSQAIAGGASDQILVFEYSHCGENYTEAGADIVGAGEEATVRFEDFRDGALNNARLINTSGSGQEGGSGYTLKGSTGQTTLGSDVSGEIILNTNETIDEEADVLGLRLIIISGTGVGQYGYISSCNPSTKSTIIRRESDNTVGWDHVVPGSTIAVDLDSTTTYRIEPRLTVNHPGFVDSYVAPATSRVWLDSTFGSTTKFFTNLAITVGTGTTIEVDPTPARFNVTKIGDRYSVGTLASGAGYAVGDVRKILGTSLGGATPANDLTITVTEVSNDSTNSIIDYKFSGTAKDGTYVALAEPNFVQYSEDGGDTWLESNLSFVGDYTRVINGANRFVAIAQDTNTCGFSYDGITWNTRALPATARWIDIAYGNNVFVAIAENSQTAAYSSTGLTWSSTSLPVGDDSTGDQWRSIAFGAGYFVAITGSLTRDVAYSTDGINWSRYNQVLPWAYNWINLEYGNGRFLAFADDGTVAFSLDQGASWSLGTTAPSLDGSTAMAWKDIKYGQGVFMAVCDTGGATFGDIGPTDGPTTFLATTEDGIVWTERELDESAYWKTVTFDHPDNVGNWVLFADNKSENGIAKISTGKRAFVRANILSGSFQEIKIIDPGSGYSASNLPVITVTDPGSITSVVEIDERIGNGVIAQPDFINRGAGYRTSTSSITIFGDGFADIIPESNTVVLTGVDPSLPGPGVQVRFASIEEETTADPEDLKLFTGVGFTDLGDDGTGNGTRIVRFQISPSLKNEYNLAHGTVVTLNERYSQCRITGHDFLDIGTGNFLETNYPDLYAGGRYFTSAPENEVEELNGGRVFYVSTDQDGNFRAGELFSVQQATGVVTISAEFFDLDGLSELSLGGVRLGGSGTVVNEFSTDPTFSADSNNIIPTQKAIATFLAAQLSVGGSDLEANNIIAGQVTFGTVDNIIDMTTGFYLNVRAPVNFDGKDALNNPTGIQGTIVGQMLFLRDAVENLQ